MNIIPAIDLLGGKAVRLHKGRYDEVTVYDDDPPARARAVRGKVPLLHVVDLEGAREGRAVQAEVVKRILEAFGPGVQVGGGVRTREAFESYLALGAQRIVVGSAAIKDPELVRALAREHAGVIVLAVDAKDGLVAIDGWTQVTSTTALDVVRSFADVPIGAVLYTDVARDGTGAGPNVEMTARLAEGSPFPVIASGGVGSLDHLRELAVRGIPYAIVGKALYDGRFSLDEAVSAARGVLSPP
jgi:phosphoribosylformimino-5-aminoimidazole carboxamide ribotide isomerase